MNIELYINGQLCDIGNPRDLGIVLKRVFIKPSELNTKDAQKSYEITLPATPHNNEIFAHINIEEVQGKFTTYPDALLYIDGVKILDGKFRLSSISRDSYRGNLGVPAPATIKDIFGETTMNQAGKWMIPFTGVKGNHSITAYNQMENPACIFPLVLYGLLPKEASYGQYSAKDIYDDQVQLTLDDIPPSVNVIQMLERIFDSAGYTLSGNALTDERLRNLYVSYKNPKEYEMMWGLGKMELRGVWGNYRNETIEKLHVYSLDKNGGPGILNMTNILHGSNLLMYEKIDEGNNIAENDNRYNIKVPYSGLYKVEFDVTFTIPENSIDAIPVSIRQEPMDQRMFEIQLLRNFSGNLVEDLNFQNSFFRDNQSYNEDVNGAIYPRPGEVHFIDPMQNKDFICGFSFGKYNALEYKKFINPAGEGVLNNPMAISGGKSWNPEVGDKSFSAVYNTGYLTRVDNGFTDAQKFRVELENAPTYSYQDGNRFAEGKVSQVVWLEKGDTISMVSVATGEMRVAFPTGKIPVWYNHHIRFHLRLAPFQQNREWLTIDDNGSSKIPMNWNDKSSFYSGEIDLMRFQPSGSKVNDWIDNFCKAFNLSLTNAGNNRFDLNVKERNIIRQSSLILDLDQKVSIRQATNDPLGLPQVFELGFTIDTSEEGYYVTMEDKLDENGYFIEKITNSGYTGGGKFYTGSRDNNTVQQTSNFSYCWYKQLYTDSSKEIPFADVPVISDHEVWDDATTYEEARNNRYMDKAQRFWYRQGLKTLKVENETVQATIVSGQYAGNKKVELNYEDKEDSIMRNFFFLLTNEKNYTTVECYLTPEEYDKLPYALVKLNGDLYNIAEVDGYDPLGKKKTKLKLIKRIR